MIDVLRWAGRRLRRIVLPLVGQPAIMAKLDQQRSALQAQEDALRALERHVSEEIDRLDGYLVYHADATRQAVGGGGQPVLFVGPSLDAIVLSPVADVVVPTREEGRSPTSSSTAWNGSSLVCDTSWHESFVPATSSSTPARAWGSIRWRSR